VIYAADIGSIAGGNFGWARLDAENDSTQVERNDGTEIAELVDAVACDLDTSRIAPTRDRDGRSIRERLSTAAEHIPRGSWTTYGDIASMIGSHARPVANCLAKWAIPNAHRILTATGELSPGFSWRDGRTDDPIALLKGEGIRFSNGRADQAQRWHPEDDQGCR
jgi:alkylated DNA nucleotide flippase Atl1